MMECRTCPLKGTHFPVARFTCLEMLVHASGTTPLYGIVLTQKYENVGLVKSFLAPINSIGAEQYELPCRSYTLKGRIPHLLTENRAVDLLTQAQF